MSTHGEPDFGWDLPPGVSERDIDPEQDPEEDESAEDEEEAREMRLLALAARLAWFKDHPDYEKVKNPPKV